jgi:hypothetical protein
MAFTDRHVSALASGGGDGSSGSPWTWAEMLTNAAENDRCLIRDDGTYSRTTSADSFTSNPGVGSIVLQGADASGNPIVVTRTNGGRGLLDTSNMPEITYTTGTLTLRSNMTAIGLNLSANRNGGVYAGGRAWISCNLRNDNNRVIGNNTSFVFINCDLTCGGSVAFTGPGYLSRCYIKSTSGTCVEYAPGSYFSLRLSDCVLYGSAIGITQSDGGGGGSNLFVTGCLIQGMSTAAFSYPNAAFSGIPSIFANCVFTDNALVYRSLYAATAAVPIIRVGNRYRDNTTMETASGFTNWDDVAAVTTDTGSQGSDFLDYSTGDFRLHKDSPIVGSGLWANDIGPIQRPENVPATTNVKHSITYGGYDGTDYTGTLINPPMFGSKSGGR